MTTPPTGKGPEVDRYYSSKTIPTDTIVFEWSDEEARAFANSAKTEEMQRIFRETGVLEQTIQVCSPSMIINK